MTAKGQVAVSFPAWRAYVFGMDVSDDIHSCVLNWADGRAPNTAQFTLSSVMDRYTVTVEDILALYDDISIDDLFKGQVGPNPILLAEEGVLSGEERAGLLSSATQTEVASRINREIKDPIKRKVLLAKVFERVSNRKQPGVADGLEEATNSLKSQALQNITSGRSVSVSGLAALSGDFLKFPFQVGSCIFHGGDPVTIFWRDPYKPTKWYFGLRGFVADLNDDAEVNGLRTVSITVQGPLRMFHQSRISTNWSIYDEEVVNVPENDTLLRSWFKDAFTGLTLPEIFYEITFGKNAFDLEKAVDNEVITEENAAKIKSVGVKGVRGFNKFYSCNGPPEDREERLEGCGVFNFEHSQIHVLGTSDSNDNSETSIRGKSFQTIENLEKWQEAVDHIVPQTVEEILVLCIPNARDSERLLWNNLKNVETGLIDVETVMRQIGEHPEIYPPDFGRLMMLIPASLGPGTNRSLLLRDLIQGLPLSTEFTTRLQTLYNIVERINFSLYDSPRGDIICEMPLYSYEPDKFGKYADRYIYTEFDTQRHASHFSDEKVRTMITVDPYTISGMESGGHLSELGKAPGAVILRPLIPAFGVRSEKAEAVGYIANREAAAYYAHIKLSQINADAWMPTIKTAMHIGVGPNRPCYFEFRDFVATTRSVTNAITVGEGQSGSVDQSIKTNYRRGWSGLMNTDRSKKVYESFGGLASQPIDFNRLFDPTQVPASTKTYNGETAHVESEEIELNKRRTFANIAIVAKKLSVSLGLNENAITASDLIGSSVRSEASNAKAGGAKHSHHLDGTAVDIPLNGKLTPLSTKLAGLGVKISPKDLGDTVAETLKSSMSEGEIDNGLVLWQDDADHEDHIHYGVGEGRRKAYWASGERS